MSRRRSCPCRVPHSGVTGTRPAAPTWPRGGSGVLGEDPAFPPCPRSPGTGPYALQRGRKPQLPSGAPCRSPPRRGGEVSTGDTAPRAAHSSQAAANQPSLPPQILLPASTAQAALHPKTPSGDRQLGTLQHRGAARPQPRTTPSPLGCHAWPPPPEEMPSPAASLPPGGLRTPVPSPPTRTWFMTLPKSIRGLACLHPKRTTPQPHLARGARGRPGGGRRGRGGQA